MKNGTQSRIVMLRKSHVLKRHTHYALDYIGHLQLDGRNVL